MPIQINLVKALRVINDGRVTIGRKPLLWHDQLHLIAQSLADWGWSNYAKASADAHHNWLGRLNAAGWIYTAEDGRLLPGPPPGMAGKTNVSEYGIDGDWQPIGEDGKEYPADNAGWHHPWRTPESHASRVVNTLVNLISDPSEGHKWDFYAEWTHIGIGYNGGIFILEYGYLP